MFVVTKDRSEIFYEISYSNDNAFLLTNGIENYLFTDGRYFEEAKRLAQNCIVTLSSSPIKSIATFARIKRIGKISFDPAGISFDEYQTLSALSKATLVPIKGALATKRSVKTNDELEKIKKAVKLGRRGFKKFAEKISSLKENPSEAKLNKIAKETLSYKGSLELSFEPITAVDENAADAHAKPSDKRLKEGSLILFDGGVKFENYCSDRTRTAFFKDGFEFSKRQEFKNKKIQHIYDTVLKAHDKAIDAAKEGMRAKDLDFIAREIIAKEGYGDYFIHSLGHGVGLDIHEYPYLNKKSEDLLVENTVFTIEPGIYIPGVCGVRLEDMVVMGR